MCDILRSSKKEELETTDNLRLQALSYRSHHLGNSLPACEQWRKFLPVLNLLNKTTQNCQHITQVGSDRFILTAVVTVV